MTCKDCLHFEACESMLRALGFPCDGDEADADERCYTFADRTRYVIREIGVWRYHTNASVKCSVCKGVCAMRSNFCPHCGTEMMIRLCPRCKRPVVPSWVDGYAWQCLDCDEDFFDIECYKAEKE